MRFKVFRLILILTAVIAFPFSSPAPLVYTPGEGWSYEPVGGEGKWTKTRAKDQLEVAQAAFDQKDFRLALKAARRVVRLLSHFRAKVNLIPWNPGNLPYRAPTPESIEEFKSILVEKGIPAFVRYSRGQDVFDNIGEHVIVIHHRVMAEDDVAVGE